LASSWTDSNAFPDTYGEWSASWITRPVLSHMNWYGYAVDVEITIEEGGAGLLFDYRGHEDHLGCELDTGSQTVMLYTVEYGTRRVFGSVHAPELSELPSSIHVTVAHREDRILLYLNGRLAFTCDALCREGTIGFYTGEGNKAVYRKLRVMDADGRSLYVNRFYDPGTIQFTAGGIDASGSGLRLEGPAIALCEDPVPADSPMFRKEFRLPAGVTRATVRMYAIGWYELHINGRKLENRVLSPANSPYERLMLYDVYDASSAVQDGDNVIGVWLGNGYNMNYSRWGWKWKRDKAFILELDLELADGSSTRITSDESWKTAYSPILENDIYDGETFDGRRMPWGWDSALYADHHWCPVVLADPPQGMLKPNRQPPVRPWEPIEPVSVRCPRDGVLVYDFGQNLAGWIRLGASGNAGSIITIRYSELADAEGNIDPWTNRRAEAKDAYILRGGGTEFYEPRFTYHGFRYVEISGGIEPAVIQAIPIHADVRETGTFSCSDPVLNRLHSNIRWSFLNNLVSIPTDCCQRDERTPCLMDSAVVEEMGMHNFDMRLYYQKWLDDIADSDTNPDWSGDKITLPWHLYWHYGDQDALAASYPSMKAYIELLADKWPEGIVKDGFGDWCAPNEDGWEHYFHEVELVNTALYYQQATIVSKTAGVLGLAEECRAYEKLAHEIRMSFHKAFGHGNGLFGSGSQTAQLMPLALGLVSGEAARMSVQRLIDAIHAKNNRLHTGIYGTRYLLDVLADHGYIDLAYELLTQKQYPGFGYQIEQGATTLWEQWSAKGAMHSHDHAMFGGIGVSLYTRLGGIRPMLPGYEQVRFEPCYPSGIDWVDVSLETVKGKIRSAWRKEGDVLRLQVTIPSHAAAVIVLHHPEDVHGAKPRLVEAGPGDHEFIVTKDAVKP